MWRTCLCRLYRPTRHSAGYWTLSVKRADFARRGDIVPAYAVDPELDLCSWGNVTPASNLTVHLHAVLQRQYTGTGRLP